jgi:LPPG:FO 2-phospho-L-lactate transferase
VSPLIGGQTVKGPANRMLKAAGYSCSNLGVADCYRGLIDSLVIDSGDSADVAALQARGLNTLVTQTLMSSDADKACLAREVLAVAGLAPQRDQRERVSA